MQTPNQERPDPQLVLAGIDLSPQSGAVMRSAARMAGREGELHALHVIPGDAVGSIRGDGALRFSNLLDEIRGKLEHLTDAGPIAVARMALHVRVGRADVEIAQLASDIVADAIVVGTHGHSTLERLILGSVAESLIRHAPCPVLVYRPKPVQSWPEIAPPCPDCVALQRSTGRKTLWCDRHSQQHHRAHTYWEVPQSFGMGSQTLR
jgi:nucleotide-binding universal stress UspA family protein